MGTPYVIVTFEQKEDIGRFLESEMISLK